MKHLAAMNIVGEKGADEYVSTPLSDALIIPKYRDGVIYKYTNIIPLPLYPDAKFR